MERPAAPSSACLFSYLVSAFARVSTLAFNLIFNVHSNTAHCRSVTYLHRRRCNKSAYCRRVIYNQICTLSGY
ncbi:hypothetical protein PR003_g15650 [Phytophthora rubi]|uniref:Uncharacterized protein n=1 Tax=Phytophthora rubi TaxID=129364 RepID=A0A6A3LSW1_9STRA|nr:hypothetical protein PR002_g14245 [Phytophthora rubi]KAE9019384.1 hypothetical protein PR001_g13891 [Phytophthora rubi]KAE9329022.1 hypothetical protein PR003_g15650 [Phytophthora rubi]